MFIAQNVASLQELGKTLNYCHKAGSLLSKNSVSGKEAAARCPLVKLSPVINAGGSEKLLRVCLNLPYFLRYINRFQDAVSANSFFIMPATVADATAVRNG